MPDLRKRRFRLLRKRPPKPIAPIAIQAAYWGELKVMLRYAQQLVRERLLPRLSGLLEGGLRVDAPPAGINRVLKQIAQAFERRYSQERLAKLAEQIARSTSEHQKTQLFRQVKSVLGIDLKTLGDRTLNARVKHFTAENVALIKSVPQTYFSEIEKVTLAGVRAGTRASEIAATIAERGSVAESSLMRIARDQVLKFNGELNRVRQQDLGVDSYVWRTVSDNRVRSAHAERDGETYQWSDPPGDPSDPTIGGHPGVAINCRCFAEPILPGIED